MLYKIFLSSVEMSNLVLRTALNIVYNNIDNYLHVNTICIY